MTDRVTLRDVAEEAGVHTSTASRALNPATRSVVNAETVDRVLSVAERLGYRPHPLARGLRTNRTMTVGMVIPDVENPLFGSIIAGVEERLGLDGYSLLIVNTDPAHMATSDLIDTLVERRVDGLILATASRLDRDIKHLRQEGIPVALVNRAVEDLDVPAVIGDDMAGIGLAVQHVLDLGHSRIGHIAGPAALSTGFGRRRAFVHWSAEAGIEGAPIEEAEWYRIEPGYRAAVRLLDGHPGLTAIVTANDLLALGAYQAIRERGGEVGRDISVTGYNDVAYVELMHPPMTAVRVPYRRMGAEAAGALLAVVAGEDGGGIRKLEPILNVRGSTAPPPD